MDVRTSIESRADGTRILRVAGELDLHTSPRFQEQLQAAIEQPCESLLVDLTPEPLRRVFFTDSGSVSVEVALKMAVQYQAAVGLPGRTRMLTIRMRTTQPWQATSGSARR